MILTSPIVRDFQTIITGIDAQLIRSAYSRRHPRAQLKIYNIFCNEHELD